MRKSLLGFVLAATLVPFATVHAAPAGAAGKAKGSYNKATKNAKDAIAAGIDAGLTAAEAMAELLEADGANAANIVAAAVAADPANAGAITAFAISKGVPPTIAVSAAITAAPSQAPAINQAALTSTPTSSPSILGGTSSVNAGVVISTPSTGSTGGGGGCGRATCS